MLYGAVIFCVTAVIKIFGNLGLLKDYIYSFMSTNLRSLIARNYLTRSILTELVKINK